MAKDAIERLQQTVLFQTLQARERETDVGHEISERVKAVVGHVSPLLERVADKMPEFTLHDPNHGAKVVELMAQFLPAETLAHLNVVELSILIYAAYLHDLGMTSSTDEREEAIRGDAEFARLLAGDEVRSQRLQRLKEEGAHRAATAVEDQVYTEYLRRTHVRRSARFLEENLSGGEGQDGALAISWQGTPYFKWVRAVCDSHELPVSRLRDTKTWPRDALVRNLRVNVQYLSLVLRLADILDLDPERTPKVLLDFIDPKDPKSVVEWRKHRSVIGWEITPERIRFEAECTHPVYERALREFLDWIEIERQDSVLLASSYRDDLSKVYRFDLTDPVTKDGVHSDGSYIYSDLKFNIDYQRVLNLLMGERLYGNPVVALRELLQNSVDAVRLREVLAAQAGDAFGPHIAVRLREDTLVVEDNGVGMDEHIVKNYFMQVGRSYYRSAEFRARQLDIDAVSEFGIGILSVFMVADRCEVESRRLPDDPLNPQPPVRVEIPTAYDYFVQRPTDRKHIGTTITLHLKPNHPFKPEAMLKTVSDIAPFIEYPVQVETEAGLAEYRPRTPGNLSGADEAGLFFVPLEGSDDPRLKGVRGGMYVVRGYGHSAVIAQRGFAVGRLAGRGNREVGLSPGWTQVAESVDLRGPARLMLTPDRASVVPDERFASLLAAISDRALKVFRAHLEGRREAMSPDRYFSYVEGLLDEDVLSLDSLDRNEGLRDIVLDLVPVPFIEGDGTLSYRFGRELEGAPAIALTVKGEWPFSASPEMVRAELDKVASPNLPLLYAMEKESSDWLQRARLIWPSEREVLISSVPGLVFEILKPPAALDLKSGNYYNYMWRFVRSVTNAVGGSSPVIAHSAGYHLNTGIFNAAHPLVSFLYEKARSEDDTRYGNIFEFLDGKLDEIYEELSAGTALVMKTPDGKYVNRNAYPNLVLNGVLSREPWVLDSLRSAFEEFWREAKDAGLIDADKPFPGLTAEDLPWFWSYEG